MCSDRDIELSIREIRSAVDTALEDRIPRTDIQHVLDEMFDFAATKNEPDLGLATVMALLEVGDRRDSTFIGRVLERGERVLNDDRVEPLIAEVQLRATLAMVEAALAGLVESFGGLKLSHQRLRFYSGVHHGHD